jgi:chloramphenicol-sensitive protein RarD
LILATSFGSYGLIRKTVAVDAMVGLGTETLLIAPLGAGYLVFCGVTGSGALGHASTFVVGLLFIGGLLTAVPLWLFSYGARRVPYATVGIVQYIGPSMQLALGVLLFHEPFTAARATGFAFIWAALAVYAGEGLFRARYSKPRRG